MTILVTYKTGDKMDEYYIEGIIDSMIDDINYVKIRMSIFVEE